MVGLQESVKHTCAWKPPRANWANQRKNLQHVCPKLSGWDLGPEFYIYCPMPIYVYTAQAMTFWVILSPSICWVCGHRNGPIWFSQKSSWKWMALTVCVLPGHQYPPSQSIKDDHDFWLRILRIIREWDISKPVFGISGALRWTCCYWFFSAFSPSKLLLPELQCGHEVLQLQKQFKDRGDLLRTVASRLVGL